MLRWLPLLLVVILGCGKAEPTAKLIGTWDIEGEQESLEFLPDGVLNAGVETGIWKPVSAEGNTVVIWMGSPEKDSEQGSQQTLNFVSDDRFTMAKPGGKPVTFVRRLDVETEERQRDRQAFRQEYQRLSGEINGLFEKRKLQMAALDARLDKEQLTDEQLLNELDSSELERLTTATLRLNTVRQEFTKRGADLQWCLSEIRGKSAAEFADEAAKQQANKNGLSKVGQEPDSPR